MAFVDEIQLTLHAGDGGHGIVRWYPQMAGPAGGDGGRGGSVYVVAVHDLGYLKNYRFEKKFDAERGGNGGKQEREGKDGDDLIIYVPVGSLVTNVETQDVYELDVLDKRVLILKGGRGGLGNARFKSSTNTSPYESTEGRPGELGEFYIELKLFADIGLVGFPSSGKSTLLNMLTNARSKVGAYHFTTLEPHLGVLDGGKVLADIPGLIEGASDGKGLGHTFLRHIQRTKMIAHLVSSDAEDVTVDYDAIRNELETFDPKIVEKNELIILSKTDLLTEEELLEKKQILEKHTGKKVVLVSAFSDEDLEKLEEIFNKEA